MSSHSIIRTLAAAALIALPSIAMAAPDQNTNNNGCPNGQWRNGNGQCVTNGNGNGNGQWNNNGNGQWNNGRHRDRDDRNNRGDRDDRNNRGDRDDRNNNGQYNNGGYNNGQYNNGQYNNGGYNNGNNGNYGNRGGQLSGQVRSFSPYNLYLSNGTHVVLHNGTVINPTGANLTSGERVRVIGNWNQDGTFNANEVDVTNNGYGNYRR
ncbi:MAG TPA: hypothetical protein VGU66_13735 [Candidatus Elarobacter sp.]|nr:hypothetical protein [Candidatus Elarobacter sp.]